MHVFLTRLGTLERFHLHRWSPCASTCILQTLGFLTGWTSHRNIENPPNNPKLQLQVADESAGSLTLDHVCTLYSSHCHWALVVCESLVDQQQAGFTVEFFHKIKLYILQRSKVSSWACWICPQIETGPLFLPGFVLADDSNTCETKSLICELAPILLDSSCSAKCWFRIIRSLRILTRCELGVRENTTQIKRLSREQPHTRSTRFTRICNRICLPQGVLVLVLCNRICLPQGVLVLVLCNRICLLWGHQWVFLCFRQFRLVFQTNLQSETRFALCCSWMMRNQEGRGRRKTSKKINSCQNLVFFPTTAANLNTRSAPHRG